MAVANRLGGLAFGALEAFFVKFYQYVVDPAPAGSWPHYVFQYLARGPFKCGNCPPACTIALDLHMIQDIVEGSSSW